MTDDSYPSGVIQQNRSITAWMKEEPLIPIGAAATVGVLVLGLVDLRRNKNPVRNHMYMRLRVLFQGLTIASLVGYTIKGQLNGTKKKPAIP